MEQDDIDTWYIRVVQCHSPLDSKPSLVLPSPCRPGAKRTAAAAAEGDKRTNTKQHEERSEATKKIKVYYATRESITRRANLVVKEVVGFSGGSRWLRPVRLKVVRAQRELSAAAAATTHRSI